jgi:ankyrin repeat protein
MSKRQRNEEVCELEPSADADAELLDACFRGTCENVEAALGKGANFFALDVQGRNGLIMACQRDPGEAAVSIVKFLLRQRCPVGLPDRTGKNALHHACLHSSAEVVRLLLEADKSAVWRLTDNSFTPLMHCMENRDLSESVIIASMLLDAGSDINAADIQNRTVLMCAALHNGPQMLLMLIRRGANVHAQNVSSLTALHFATVNGAFGG